MSYLDNTISELLKHGARAVTFTIGEQNQPVIVVKQQVRNSSGLTSDHTIAHTGKNYADAYDRARQDVEFIAGHETPPQIIQEPNSKLIIPMNQ